MSGMGEDHGVCQWEQWVEKRRDVFILLHADDKNDLSRMDALVFREKLGECRRRRRIVCPIEQHGRMLRDALQPSGPPDRAKALSNAVFTDGHACVTKPFYGSERTRGILNLMAPHQRTVQVRI